MASKKQVFRSFLLRTVCGVVIASLLAGCGVNLSGGVQQTAAPSAEPPAVPTYAEVTFQVETPADLPDALKEEPVSIDILDEITGLALNQLHYAMQPVDANHFEAKLLLPPQSVVKYRYSRGADFLGAEYSAAGQQVRYRMVYVTTSSLVQDRISAWNDAPYSGPRGRIVGTILTASDNIPLPNLLVTAGGMTTLTSASGEFRLEGLAIGTHNVAVYPLDGSVLPYQQGATIAADSTTPVTIKVTPVAMVNITFHLTIPKEAIGVPVRIAGSLYSMGNTFADLNGGMNTIASRMPVMDYVSEDQYAITLSLPVGYDLRYKYTLGDGFFNAEQSTDGKFVLRQLIVPGSDQTIEDTVATWKSANTGRQPVTFDVTVPADTPPTDTVSIQFNPYGWTEPIPMWSVGDNHWVYILFSPLQMISKMYYRYCRNDQCGSADDAATMGQQTDGAPAEITDTAKTIQDTVKAWAFWQPPAVPTSVAAAEVKPREATFVKGFEFSANYLPSWQPRYLSALQNIQSIGANWAFLTPTWSYTSQNPPVLQAAAGKNPLWMDITQTIQQAHAVKLSTAVFPQPLFPGPAGLWWRQSNRDFSWWKVWFEEYTQFILHYAVLAETSKAEAFVMGGDWVSPALPLGKLDDGSPSGVPQDAEIRWRNLLVEVRARYKGKILWAVSSSSGSAAPPAFLDAVDAVYVILNAKLVDANQSAAVKDLEAALSNQLDGDIAGLHNRFQKDILLGVDYPSIDGAANACIPLAQAEEKAPTCMDASLLAPGAADIPDIAVNLQAQVDIYNAVFSAVNTRDWIKGVISTRFYVPAALQDKSASVHGKPAFDVVWYWFSRLVK